MSAICDCGHVKAGDLPASWCEDVAATRGLDLAKLREARDLLNSTLHPFTDITKIRFEDGPLPLALKCFSCKAMTAKLVDWVVHSSYGMQVEVVTECPCGMFHSNLFDPRSTNYGQIARLYYGH